MSEIPFIGVEFDVLFEQGFRKIDAEKWEFANEEFLRGHKHLLKNIRRKKPSSSASASPSPPPPVVELGRFGQDGEAERLRRDKDVLMTELVKLRQQQQNDRLYLQEIERRLRGTEKKQQQMMRFLANAMQNPDFMSQLIRNKERRKGRIEEEICPKRSRPIENAETSQSDRGLNSGVKAEFDEFGGFEVSELEALALEMQRSGKAKSGCDGENRNFDRHRSRDSDREADAGFWNELLDGGVDEEGKIEKNEDGDL